MLHTTVRGAAGYVVDVPRRGRLACNEPVAGLCYVTFSGGADPGCGVTLRAVDTAGRAGVASTSFCVVVVD